MKMFTKYLCLLAALSLSLIVGCASDETVKPPDAKLELKLEGKVVGGDSGNTIPDVTVTLYLAKTKNKNGDSIDAKTLGQAKSKDGNFTIEYTPLDEPDGVFYVTADGKGIRDGVLFASVLGQTLPENIVVNELTTVATAFAMAQFKSGSVLAGPWPGLQNAAATAGNLVNAGSGKVGVVLNTDPNGEATPTLSILNSLANMLAACVSDSDNCATLFEHTTLEGQGAPANTFDAAHQIALYPWNNASDLTGFNTKLYAGKNPPYMPDLANAGDEDWRREFTLNAWTLALRYDGRRKSDPKVADERTLSGPGNVAFDESGNVWVSNNYVFSEDRSSSSVVCGANYVIKLDPTGDSFCDGGKCSPYYGGGLYGAGFGIALDPGGNAWVSNFGFEGMINPTVAGSGCQFEQTNPESGSAEDAFVDSLYRSVSKFASDGTPAKGTAAEKGDYAPHVTPPCGIYKKGDVPCFDKVPVPNVSVEKPGGYRGDGKIFQPQQVLSDEHGNLLIVNCGGNSVTRFPGENGIANPQKATTITPTGEGGLDKPFGMTLDRYGNAWVASNNNPQCEKPIKGPTFNLCRQYSEYGAVVAIGKEFDSATPIHTLAGSAATEAGISHPMGIASDSLGNIWVANSGGMNPPCGPLDSGYPPIPRLGPADFKDVIKARGKSFQVPQPNPDVPESYPHASVTKINADTGVASKAYKGAGLFLPWGIAVDGNDNIWVANFGGSRLSNLCGANPGACPPGKQTTGGAISPESGYNFTGLERNTGVQIDPSGNVWLTNNWVNAACVAKANKKCLMTNPGGNELVVFVGLAAPVKAPLIGPPQSVWTECSVSAASSVNWKGCDKTNAQLQQVELSGSNLMGVNLGGASLEQSNLSNVALQRANLKGAAMQQVNLSGANLSGANLSGASLGQANLSGANLSGANITGADLTGATCNNETIWSNGKPVQGDECPTPD